MTVKRYQVWQTWPENNDNLVTTDDYLEAVRAAEGLVRPKNPSFIVDTTTHEKVLTRIMGV